MTIITGTSGNDTLYDTSGTDTIYGLAGDDIIYVTTGNDQVYGGEGDDIIYGGSEANHYYYNLGDGNDVIHEASSGGTDVLYLGDGTTSSISADDLSFQQSSNDLIVSINDGGGSVQGTVTIADYFASSAMDTIETIRTTHAVSGYGATYEDINPYSLLSSDSNLVVATTTGTETLYAPATADNHIILGGLGDNTIYGSDTSGAVDYIYAGNGADTIQGGIETDYVWSGTGAIQSIWVTAMTSLMAVPATTRSPGAMAQTTSLAATATTLYTGTMLLA